MRKKFGSVLRIGLTKNAITLGLCTGWLRTRSEILAERHIPEEEGATFETVVTNLSAMLKEAHCSRLPARIVLSDNWVRRWMVTPPANASSLADCQAAAQARFHALFGESMADWQLAADWNASQPFLACAIPRRLLAALQQLARDHELTLLEIAPQFVLAWNRWRKDLKPGVWFGVLHEQVLSVAVPGERGLEVIRELLLPDEVMFDQQRVPEILVREALRLNVPMPSEMRWCGQIPANWVTRKTSNITFVRLERDSLAQTPLSAGASLAFTGTNVGWVQPIIAAGMQA